MGRVGSREGDPKNYGKEGLRKCATPGCNKMTHNYRYHACWVKIQGFAPYEREDIADTQAKPTRARNLSE